MSWRVLVTDGLAEEGLNLLRQEAELIEADGLGQLDSVDALIVRGRTRVSAEVLQDSASRLRVIGRAGVGVDNIDLEAARAHNIVVVNAPEAATVAVAELTIGLLLSLARRIPFADARTRQGEWRKKELKGVELNGKTLGIVGLGRIGSAVAERAGALGMHAAGYDPLLSPEEIRHRGAEPVDFDRLLAEADYLCLHLPLNDETRGMIDSQALQKMKPGARLISAARGGIVDEAALLDALDSGHLAGAALDVFSVEPPGQSRLLEHPNMISTPHIGAQTLEAQAKAGTDIAAEVMAALRGESLRWRII